MMFLALNRSHLVRRTQELLDYTTAKGYRLTPSVKVAIVDSTVDVFSITVDRDNYAIAAEFGAQLLEAVRLVTAEVDRRRATEQAAAASQEADAMLRARDRQEGGGR